VVVGGVVVSAFSLLGDLLKPKSFAGLFGAAPSIALATLVLTVTTEGKGYAGVEGRSMLVGAVAFFFYALVASRLLMARKTRALTVASLAMPLWFACAFGLLYVVIGSGR
jgi:hypothetical protein